ncbi:MAG: single-stranded DNA-binding protein [Acidovorax soli]|uniref:single-stranded DNA-binding protein n=1 Tax=Acidovorax soli TaxID=592050 RepID=UPI0026EE58A8|nr:single-stranded DNA-binding protein [Acidovorax soli]MCM2346122.1 single-stranded DNA-binding protein [Acidovorax soli]
MFDVLLSGRLRGAAQLRTAANGSPFATFRLAAASKTGESLLCSCVTFSQTVIDAVKALGDGDSLAVSGEAAISTWRGQDGSARLGLDVTAFAVLTAYHVGRKRKPAAATAEGTGAHA